MVFKVLFESKVFLITSIFLTMRNASDVIFVSNPFLVKIRYI
jgi:hypothetical protein